MRFPSDYLPSIEEHIDDKIQKMVDDLRLLYYSNYLQEQVTKLNEVEKREMWVDWFSNDGNYLISLTISSFYLATCTRLFQKLVHDLRIDFFLTSDCHFPRLHTTEQSIYIWSPNFTNLPRCLMDRKYLPLLIPPLKDARRKSALTNDVLVLATEESVRYSEGRCRLGYLPFTRHQESHAPSSMWPSSHTHVMPIRMPSDVESLCRNTKSWRRGKEDHWDDGTFPTNGTSRADHQEQGQCDQVAI